MTDRDAFAAAALTGLLASEHPAGQIEMCEDAYRIADDMIRVRERANLQAKPDSCGTSAQNETGSGNVTGKRAVPDAWATAYAVTRACEIANHDAAPEAKADLPDERPPNMRCQQTGGTPCAASRDGSGTGNTPEPVAWAVCHRQGACGPVKVSLLEPRYIDWPSDKWSLVPLYAHPPQDRVVRLPKADEHHGGWLHTVESCVLERVQAALGAAGVKWEVEK